MKQIFVIILLFLFTNSFYGQNDSANVKQNFKFDWIITPAYTPELGGLLSLSGIMSFKTNVKDSLIQKSSLPVSLGVSTSGAIIFSGILTSFWFEDKIRLYAKVYLKDMPDKYWGVGYEDAVYKYSSDDDVKYHRQWYQINPQVLYRFFPDFYAGIVLDINRTIFSNMSDKMLEDEHIYKFGNDNFNIGLGFTGQYDSRDVPVNAYKGWFLSYSAIYYDKALSSDNTYFSGDIDFRYYKYVKKIDAVFAFQTHFRGVTYGAPYAELSQLGTPFDLRGYYWGKFRDNVMLYSILEYRQMLTPTLKILGRNMRQGIVLWNGLGTVAHHFNQIKYALPNVGIGYRIEVEKRMNVRFDLGFGKNSTGFYINFNEAF